MRNVDRYRRAAVVVFNGAIAAYLANAYWTNRVYRLEDPVKHANFPPMGWHDYLYVAIPVVGLLVEFLSFKVSWLYNVGWPAFASALIWVGFFLALTQRFEFSEPEHWFAIAMGLGIPGFVCAAILYFLFHAANNRRAPA